MPRYKCHKEVWALKIDATQKNEDDSITLSFAEEGYAPITVPADYGRGRPVLAGGYYVVYEDGYVSWSPADVFESGYTQVSP